MNTTLKTTLAALLIAALPTNASAQARMSDDATIVSKLEAYRYAHLSCSGDVSVSKEEIEKQVMGCLCLIDGMTNIKAYDTPVASSWIFTAMHKGHGVTGTVEIVSHH